MPKVNSYEDLVKTFAKSHFKRGIVKTKNRNDKLVREILTNNNLQNFMIHYLAKDMMRLINNIKILKVLISIMEIKTFYCVPGMALI